MKVLFFSPFSNIWEHSFPEALIAEGLAKQGAEVQMVRCGGMFDSHCVAMSASGVSASDSYERRKQVCRACIKRRDLLTSEMALPTVILDDVVSADDRAAAEEAIAAATIENWPVLLVDGHPLPRYAAYEFLLSHKLIGVEIPERLWAEYLQQLRLTVTTYYVAKRMLASDRPDRLIVFNRLYSLNHAFCVAAEQAGIPTYTLQGGGHVLRRGETMTMYRDSKSLADVFDTRAWTDYRDHPIGPAEVALVGEHLSGLLEASSAFAYSSAFEASDPGELKAKFGIPPGKKVLLVPMSSEDEINAARLADALPESNGQQSLFATQFEWIDFLLDYARTHPQHHLVIRLHPRMFPNKRENVRSPMADRLLAILADVPPNVSTNLPSDEVSLYDLMQLVDVVLSFRSSVGVELAAFGIPVVVPSNADFYTYPTEINLTGHTLDDYRDKIEESITAGWSMDNSRKAFRWFAFLFSRIAVDFSDSVSARPIAIRPKKPGVRLWLWRKAVYVFIQFGPLVRERIALRNRRFPVTSQQLFLDVLETNRSNLSESALWHPLDSTVETERASLDAYLQGLTASLWEQISTEGSLAERIRSARPAA